jgi:signal transduction histidine kinase
MTTKRDPSKAVQLGFLALLAISAATAAFWIGDSIRNTRMVEQRFATIYADASPAQLRAWFPELAAANLADLETLRAWALTELERESAARTNRYVWEGAFFLGVLAGGMLILTRTIRHDAELRRRQQNFLAAVSHEFKSPLASVQLAAETLVLRSADGDGKRLGQRILEDCERLLRMVDNLLDTTRLEEGRHRLVPERVDLRNAIAASVAGITDRAQRHGVRCDTDVAEGLVLSVDRTALESILRNLLDNAVKACVAGSGTMISISAAHAGGKVELTVRDDGLGFPPEEAAMMFEKFYRLGDELRRTTPGTGLGLYIVKRLAELSGAMVSATSAGPGNGAAVTVTWPESALQ